MKQLLYFLLILILYSCSTKKIINIGEINGIYENKETSEYFIFDKNHNFVLKTRLAPHPSRHSDVISMGKWNLNNNYLILDNSELLKEFPKISVKEEAGKNKDSLYFYFNSPFENISGFENSICYAIEPVNIDGKYYKEVNNNYIVMPFTENTEFIIDYHISCDFFKTIERGKASGIIPFFRKKPQANIFYVSVDFDYKYFTYIRFKQDYVKVISRNKILWNGKMFTKIH